MQLCVFYDSSVMISLWYVIKIVKYKVLNVNRDFFICGLWCFIENNAFRNTGSI